MSSAQADLLLKMTQQQHLSTNTYVWVDAHTCTLGGREMDGS